jgi:hypothetical protein
MRRTIAVLVCTAAAVTAAGCGSASDGTDITGRSAAAATSEPAPASGDPEPVATTPADGPKTWKMGYRSTIFDDSRTDILRLTVTAPRTLAPEAYFKPKNGRWLAVTVTYEALQPAQPINPYDLVAVTTNGERLQPTFGPEAAGVQLQYATLNTGEKAKGTVVFDVPAKGVTGIAYAPVGQVIGTWTL